MKKTFILLMALLLLFSFGCSDDDAAATYTVTYAANGATGGDVPVDSGAYAAGADVTVLSNTGNLVKTDYTFAGWNSAADGNGTNYAADSTFTMPATNVTLYAKWTINQYTVTYDSQSADTAADPASQTVDYNTAVGTLPTPPEKNGYTFEGWYTAADGGGGEFTTATAVTADITVYAYWKTDPFSGISYRDMVSVPGGTYTQTDTDDNNFEHTISDFSIGKYEVTYQLWHTVYSWATNNGYTFANAGKEGNNGTAGAAPTTAELEPVTTVNWRDVMVWCNAYSEMAGYTPVYWSDSGYTTPIKNSTDGSYGSSVNTTEGSYDNPYVNWSADGYRLPTEGEWQYAASYQDGSSWTPYNHASGDTTSYCYPDDAGTSTVFGDYAWYNDNSGSTTHDVGTKTANQLGIHDMSGNVFEWCWDWKDDYPTGSQSDYRGAASGSGRVLRGGSYFGSAGILQVGVRYKYSPYKEFSFLGFRLSRTP